MTLGVPTSLAWQEPRTAATSDILWNIPVEQHQALSHCTGESNLHLPRFGSARSVWGCLGLDFPVPENKSIQSYVPCPTQAETQWDEEEPSPGKVPAAFNAPQQTQPETEQGHDPRHHSTPSAFHRANPTALATGPWWAIASSATAGSWSADWKPNSTFFRKAWPHLNPQGDQW